MTPYSLLGLIRPREPLGDFQTGLAFFFPQSSASVGYVQNFSMVFFRYLCVIVLSKFLVLDDIARAMELKPINVFSPPPGRHHLVF